MYTSSGFSVALGFALVCAALSSGACSRSHRGRHAQRDAGDAALEAGAAGAELDAAETDKDEDAASDDAALDASVPDVSDGDPDSGSVHATLLAPSNGTEFYTHEEVPLSARCSDGADAAYGEGQFEVTRLDTKAAHFLTGVATHARLDVGEYEVALHCRAGTALHSSRARIRVLPVPEVVYVGREADHPNVDELAVVSVDAPGRSRSSTRPSASWR